LWREQVVSYGSFPDGVGVKHLTLITPSKEARQKYPSIPEQFSLIVYRKFYKRNAKHAEIHDWAKPNNYFCIFSNKNLTKMRFETKNAKHFLSGLKFL